MIDYQALQRQFDAQAPRFFTTHRHEVTKAQSSWLQFLQGKSWETIALELPGMSRVTTWQGAIDQSFAVGTIFPAYTVLGVDGSQVYADRHSGLPWSLLSIAQVCFSYTPESGSATFTSTPFVIHEYQEPTVLDARRSLLELQMGIACVRALPASAHNFLLFDGPLSPSLDSDPSGLGAQFKALLQTCQEHALVLAGYTSAPRARELVRLLEAVVERQTKSGDDTASFDEVTDLDLVTLFLQPGFRTTWFASTTCNIDLAPPLRLCVTYLHVGSEIVRVEVPQYLAADTEKCALLFGMIWDQVQKGHGYPVVLAEAHEHAVIREADRQLFFQLATRKASELGVYPAASLKSLKKRFPLV